jgi:hypothetical protein
LDPGWNNVSSWRASSQEELVDVGCLLDFAYAEATALKLRLISTSWWIAEEDHMKDASALLFSAAA